MPKHGPSVLLRCCRRSGTAAVWWHSPLVPRFREVDQSHDLSPRPQRGRPAAHQPPSRDSGTPSRGRPRPRRQQGGARCSVSVLSRPPQRRPSRSFCGRPKLLNDVCPGPDASAFSQPARLASRRAFRDHLPPSLSRNVRSRGGLCTERADDTYAGRPTNSASAWGRKHFLFSTSCAGHRSPGDGKVGAPTTGLNVMKWLVL